MSRAGGTGGVGEGVPLPLATLREWAVAVYGWAGMPGGDAAVVADAQLLADRRGVDTHGLQRLPWYVDRLRAGQNHPRPHLDVVAETPVSLTLDGDNGLGQLVCTRLAERVVEKAATTGLAVGAARRSNDWGCGATYPLLVARAGLVCFATTTSIPTIAPWGSRTRLTGNNPVVFAVPRRSAPPIVLDMALTPVALGKVMRARAEGAAIPEAWGFRDRDGLPTADPTTALAGLIPAIGGHKGTGLSMVTNVLAGILTGSSHTERVANEGGHRGQLLWAVDPGLLGERDAFFDEVESMVATVKAAKPLPGVDEVLLPGEPEQRHADEADRWGTLTYPPSVVSALEEVAERAGVALR